MPDQPIAPVRRIAQSEPFDRFRFYTAPFEIISGLATLRAGELLLASARIGLRRHALDSVAMTPVLGSLLGERASLVGAVLMAAERTELVVDGT